MKCVPDIEYDPTRNLALDLYLPDSLKAKACVIYVHGGGFSRGDKAHVEAAHFAARLTEHGLAVASVDHRLGTTLDAFDQDDQELIETYMARTAKVGLTLSEKLYGPAFIAAIEDVSKAIEYLWVEGAELGIKSRKVGVLGVSSGGIVGLALAYPPMHWVDRVVRPEAVVAIAGALVQPWRLEENGPPCLMFHGPQDRIINIGNVQLVAGRAEQVGAPIELIDTGVPGHATQVDATLDGKDRSGEPYIDRIVAHFAALKE